MKITLYTIADCPFCKQEKDYLVSHNLAYEEKNLETNKEYLTEMLAVSNNFAGTPVTKIEKDNGTSSVLKGFTKEEFDQTLGFVAAPAVASVVTQQSPQPQEPPPAPTPTPPPSTPEPPVAPQPPASPEPSMPPVVEPPVAPSVPAAASDTNPTPSSPQPPLPEPPVPSAPQPNPEPVPQQPAAPTMPSLDGLQTPQQTTQADKLNSVLENLQAKVMNPPTAAIPAPGTASNAAGAMPTIPEPNFN